MALLLAIAGPSALRQYWWWRESNPIRRGSEIAASVGCLSCHGPEGTRGLRDPATGRNVPTWDGGVPMMYVDGPDEVRQYVLEGVSERRAASASASAERAASAIVMPAYRDVLDQEEVEDVVAYFMAAARMATIEDGPASRGRDLVVEHGCEACHGLGGAGGVRNPGSLKGYIPGWLGADFEDLVSSEDELREWILEGGIGRLRDDRLARFFLRRQRLQMPPYRASLSEENLEDMIAYIAWLRMAR